MKTLLFRNAALVVLAVGALAVATGASVAQPLPLFNWSGFYVGGNVGGSWGQMNTTVLLGGAPFGSTTQSMNGWLGGLQAGYNAQSGVWVFGIEADIQATSQRGSPTFGGATAEIPAIPAIPCILIDPPAPACIPGTGIPGVPAIPGVPGTVSYRQELPWFATFRVRLGVVATPTWLFYVTGGLAVGGIRTNASFTIPTAAVASSFSDVKAGWVTGGGFEWALSPNWSFKVEYLYIDFGYINNGVASIPPFVGTFTASSHITDNVVRVGLNYRFAPGT